MNAVDRDKVCVVTVTYGNRFELLQRVIKAALALGVGKVIVVDNASEPESRRQLRELERASQGKVEVVYLPENLGSAGGYKAGLEHASRDRTCEFIWLLDDDNEPAEDALNELQAQYRSLEATYTPDKLMLLALREDRAYLQAALRTAHPRKGFPRKSSFLRFHILDLPEKLGKLFTLRSAADDRPAARSQAPVKIPYGPYGGLFFHRSVISGIGLPDDRFYLYGDDFEYTYRVTDAGGGVFLVPSSRITDIDRAWHIQAKGGFWSTRLLLGDSDTRVYYVVRNRTYFEKFIWGDADLVYTLNRWVFLALLRVLALRYRRQVRYQMILKAVQDGESERLGRREVSVA